MIGPRLNRQEKCMAVRPFDFFSGLESRRHGSEQHGTLATGRAGIYARTC